MPYCSKSKINTRNNKMSATIHWLLCLTKICHPDILQSGMILARHSDAGYLKKCNACSRVEGHHYLSETMPFPPNNGTIFNLTKIIKKSCHHWQRQRWAPATLMHAKLSKYKKLEKMRYPQLPTLMQTYNSMAKGIIHSRVQPKQTKAIDKHFHWLHN